MILAESSPSVEKVGGPMRERLAGFARTLRDNGFKVGLAETRDALAILTHSVASRPTSLRSAFRSLFCATHSDWERFDEIFDAHWLGFHMRRMHTLSGIAAESRTPARRRSDTVTSQGSIGQPDHVERRKEGDGRGVADGRGRRVRREQIRRRGRRLDLRRTIHRNVSHGGTPVDLAWRRRKIKPLRLVVLLDASGSMNLYTAFFVRFLHGVVDAFHEAEAFVFHTRLAHVSPSLRDRDVTRAVDRLSLMAQGIGGGTRIGDSLATFNRWHARRVINSRTAVMIVSDGYDTGEPERLANEMRRLRRRCRRIVWLNPLIGWEGYAPEARGMQAALPYVDLFAAAHSIESLAALEPYLARL